MKGPRSRNVGWRSPRFLTPSSCFSVERAWRPRSPVPPARVAGWCAFTSLSFDISCAGSAAHTRPTAAAGRAKAAPSHPQDRERALGRAACGVACGNGVTTGLATQLAVEARVLHAVFIGVERATGAAGPAAAGRAPRMLDIGVARLHKAADKTDQRDTEQRVPACAIERARVFWFRQAAHRGNAAVRRMISGPTDRTPAGASSSGSAACHG
jgi:hypothetical protein